MRAVVITAERDNIWPAGLTDRMVAVTVGTVRLSNRKTGGCAPHAQTKGLVPGGSCRKRGWLGCLCLND